MIAAVNRAWIEVVTVLGGVRAGTIYTVIACAEIAIIAAVAGFVAQAIGGIASIRMARFDCWAHNWIVGALAGDVATLVGRTHVVIVASKVWSATLASHWITGIDSANIVVSADRSVGASVIDRITIIFGADIVIVAVVVV